MGIRTVGIEEEFLLFRRDAPRLRDLIATGAARSRTRPGWRHCAGHW